MTNYTALYDRLHGNGMRLAVHTAAAKNGPRKVTALSFRAAGQEFRSPVMYRRVDPDGLTKALDIAAERLLVEAGWE